jgi:hypothetical protein
MIQRVGLTQSFVTYDQQRHQQRHQVQHLHYDARELGVHKEKRRKKIYRDRAFGVSDCDCDCDCERVWTRWSIIMIDILL